MAEEDGSSSEVKVTNRTLSEAETSPCSPELLIFRAKTSPGVATKAAWRTKESLGPAVASVDHSKGGGEKVHLSFVVLVGGATVELQLRIRVITQVVLAHPGDEGEVLVVLNPQCP